MGFILGRIPKLENGCVKWSLHPKLFDEDYKSALVGRGLQIASNNFEFGINVKKNSVNKKNAYSLAKLEEKLVARKLLQNLKQSFNIKLKSRNIIVQEINSFLSDGYEFKALKLDIKSFYENINIDNLLERIFKNNYLSTHSKTLVQEILNYFNDYYESGVPRGIEISPILAEIYLMDFDNYIKCIKDVYYYTRFVDDMLILSSPNISGSELVKITKKALPIGLSLNYNKQKIIDFEIQEKNVPKTISFDFLGYKYSVTDCCEKKQDVKLKFREVKIDISSNKIKMIKKKIALSFFNHKKKPNFNLLLDRILFLTTNRYLFTADKKQLISTGIFYNYPYIGADSNGIKELDAFLKGLLFGGRSRQSKALSGTLSDSQKSRISKISFKHGYKKKTFKKFSPNRLRLITHVWK